MKKIDMNQNWYVQKEGSPDIRRTNLPDDAMLREKRTSNAKSGSAGAFFEGGKYTYQKEWNVPADLCTKSLILEFEGVYQDCKVFLNDQKIAQHFYGYTGFFIDVTGKVVEGKNKLCVVVDNSKIPNTRWYSGSGIYREVHLYVGEKEYIEPDGIKVTVIGKDQINIKTSCRMNESSRAEINVMDGSQIIASAEGTDVTLTIPDVKPWDAEHPFIYTCRVSLYKDSTVIDSSETRFGMRTLTWGKTGLLVNGIPVKLRGACIHHDNGILGACAFKDAEVRRVRILKEAGFNAIRSAHNPISKAMLDACDEQGMYIMDEAFDMWLVHKNPYDYAGEKYNAYWKQDVQAMIDKDYNHPSVILYSIGNEISELGRPDGQDAAKHMIEFCHKADASRPVTAGINLALAQMASFSKKSKPFANDEDHGIDDTTKAPTSEFFNKLMNYLGNRMDKAAATGHANKIAAELRKIVDIPGYNYATSRYAKDAKEVPNQPTVGSETFTSSLYKNWHLVEQYPTLIGDFMWTGWDYLGESGIGTIQYMDPKTKKNVDSGLIISSGAGVIDICGMERPETGWNKIIWGLQKEPVLAVDPYTHADHFKSKRMWRKADTIRSWSWHGCEGKKGNVIVYSSAPYIKLVCNGKVIGKQKTNEDQALFKNVPYIPGKLEAVEMTQDGKELNSTFLTTAKEETKITLIPDKKELTANGQDLCFLNIEITDQNGTAKSSQDQHLQIKVTGAGTLQGFGSARPTTDENFVDPVHRTFYGKALAVIRAGYAPGNIEVEVSGKNLTKQIIQIKAIEDKEEITL